MDADIVPRQYKKSDERLSDSYKLTRKTARLVIRDIIREDSLVNIRVNNLQIIKTVIISPLETCNIF